MDIWGEKVEKIADAITEWMIEKHIICREDKKIYITGICQFISIILDFLGIVLIGIVFDELVRIIFFSILFMYLQRYAGSYHAKTRIGCYCGSMDIVIVNSVCFRYGTFPIVILMGLLIISVISINILAPVENCRKRLDNLERKVYGRKTHVISALYVIVYMCLLICGDRYYSQIIVQVLCSGVCVQGMGKIALLQFTTYN
mgnify:FL=1